MPSPGTKVDIVGVGTATVLERQPAVQAGLYSGLAGSFKDLPPGFDCGCTLKVQYADGTVDTVSAAQNPPSVLETFAPIAGYAAYGAATVALDSYEYESEYDRMQKRYEDKLAEEVDPDHSSLLPSGLLAEISGEYWGGSEESDDGDQAIRCNFRFEKNGHIKGRGRDDVDGSYKIVGGRWAAESGGKKLKMMWKEAYDDGFTTICTGMYDAKTGKIDARFASSRDVSGVFELSKKPNIF